jgi:hypothetical protein
VLINVLVDVCVRVCVCACVSLFFCRSGSQSLPASLPLCLALSVSPSLCLSLCLAVLCCPSYLDVCEGGGGVMVVLRIVGHDLRLQVVGGGGRSAHAGGEGAAEDEVDERVRRGRGTERTKGVSSSRGCGRERG